MHADGTVARIEVPSAEIERAAACRAALDSAVREVGFRFAALDLGGFASGRMNVLLAQPSMPIVARWGRRDAFRGVRTERNR